MRMHHFRCISKSWLVILNKTWEDSSLQNTDNGILGGLVIDGKAMFSISGYPRTYR